MTDRPERTLMIAVTILSLLMVLCFYLAAGSLADRYESSLIAHDAALVGRLSRSGISDHDLVAAVSGEAAEEDRLAGQRILMAAGLTVETGRNFLPDAEQYHHTAVVTLLSLTLVFAALLLAAFYLSARQRARRLELAAFKVGRFLDGDSAARIDDNGEGGLARFFALVNTMATSLQAHIEKEQRSREFLADTISDISHQLKTPLAALSMYNEILEDETKGNGTAESFTAKSRRELERMESLILNLLKLARLDAGAIELEKRKRNLSDLLSDCLSSFQTRAETEGKTLSLLCDGALCMPVDEVWFSEAVGNLIKNALDHTGEGGMVSVRCAETPAALEIAVEDNGSGIHPEDLHHIFKRFYRSRFSRDKHGIGIGLSLTRAIVERHGGAVAVESQWGEGTCFRLIFPRMTKL
jgi:signal transduction histidine kinase